MARRTPSQTSSRTERFDFQGAAGRKLSGRLERAAGRRRGAVLFAHCFTCGKAALPAVRISRALAGRGFDVLRFDFAGLGESEGDFADTTFSSNVEDLEAAASAMAEAGCAPDVLVGHSLGGAAVIAAAASLPSVRAVATIGAPADLEHLMALLGGALPEIEADGVAEVDLGGARPARVGRGFVEALRSHDLAADVQALKRPYLVLQAPEDRIVAAENGLQLFALAQGAKSYVSLDGADHLLSDPAHVAYAAEVLCAWSGLEAPAVPEPEPDEGWVEVSETGAGGYQVEVLTAAGRFLADEPEDVGGLGSGPTPYELLSAALGACTAMTLRMYAGRKDIALDPVAVQVAHAKSDGRDRFERRLLLPDGLSEEQQRRLQEIAGKCPVHRTLTGVAEVSTRRTRPTPQSARAEHLQDLTATLDEDAADVTPRDGE
jgi:putative redox protein